MSLIKRGLFLSDLHLFSRRSTGYDCRPAVAEYRQATDAVVLGGDIFDFRWAQFASFEYAYSAAVEWLQQLLSASGNSQIIYLLGNHDSTPAYVQRLRELELAERRFRLFPHHCRIGENLFLHGDLLDAGLQLDTLTEYRRRFEHASVQPEWKHRCYDVAVWLRLHRLVPTLVHRSATTCERLWTGIRTLPIDTGQIQSVYFGHTHVAMTAIQYQGVAFYNPGAALKYMQLQPHAFEVTDELAQPAE